jgi:peptidoglycan/LPS O-acetylase OafA/YrhL
MLGVCIYYYHEQIPLRPWAGWLCAVIAWCCSWYAPAMLVFPIFFAYAVVVAGFLGKPKQIEKRGDISYGVYLYGWPVQLIVSLLIGKSVGVWGYILISAIVVIPFGILSWLLVEKPSIGLVKRFRKPNPVAPSES